MRNLSKKQIAIIVLVVLIFITLIVVGIINGVNKAGKNQFGDYITVQNYDEKIKNVSPDVKDVIQSSLYNIVKYNSPDSFNASTVKDAYIREGSDSQTYNDETNVYSGTFIIDMASIKQSFETQYSYSTTNTIDTGGDPIVLSCPSKEQLKYGDFNCKDFVTAQAGSNDAILQYLPFANFDFKISPNSTGPTGALVLDVQLRIPDSDLAGDTNSRTQTVAMYKKEVTDWVQSKGLDATKYTYNYDYSDTGDYIGPPITAATSN